MHNKEFTNIPDLQLLFAVHPLEDDKDDEAKIEILRPVNKWVGECGLSSDDNSMIRKLRIMIDSSGETDYALMISLRERSRWHQPKDDSLASQVLCASPTVDYKDFIPHHIKKSLKFGPVTIQSHIWIDMCEQETEMFAEGTIYPEIKMGDVERMLSEAAKSLKDYIISLMEEMGLEEPAIWSVHESHPVWDPMLSSNPTASSSTNQPHMPSTKLLIDVEPECSVKKAKVGDGKVPKAKARGKAKKS
ncbi:hypothetical protein EV702DRAFT_1201868 [Suillus placidus]|uniref:Uncharacterized protein n=1 Tax=Suillus placidus TaxID=48579 RepID=A0A9P6ZM07_9AGAM|nr:hypothetical protein EV702DRAFT_1201868 [Suillus placidus]